MCDSKKVQTFGGPWSLIKTDLVAQYMQFFNTALKNMRFRRIYIDAFAGSGAFQYTEGDTRQGGFFPPDVHDGSAKRALAVQPAFDRIVFIEQDSGNVAALNQLIRASDHPNASVHQGDANQIVREICTRERWGRQRGVIFLDPFAMSVEWQTLEAIAGTRALDVWFLFALAGTVRNLPRLADRLDDSKRNAVTRVLGTAEWFNRFYSEMTIPRTMITPERKVLRRVVSVEDIEHYVKQRLETIFPYVEKPRRLRQRNRSLFSLFFAISNPSQKAMELAKRAARHILAS